MVVFGLFPVRGLPRFAIYTPLPSAAFPFLVPLNLLQDRLFQPPAQGLLLNDGGNSTLVENVRVNSDGGIWSISCPWSTTLCHIYIVIAVILKVKEVLD